MAGLVRLHLVTTVRFREAQNRIRPAGLGRNYHFQNKQKEKYLMAAFDKSAKFL